MPQETHSTQPVQNDKPAAQPSAANGGKGNHNSTRNNRGHAKSQKRKRDDPNSKANMKSNKRFNRKWDGPSRRDRNVDTRPEVENEEKEERRPKKKVACFIGYSGEGYHGMQYNPPMKTIEGDIYEAFSKAGVILKANAVDPAKSSFQRAARTDKGVHAAGNLISLKLMIGDDPNDVVDKVNTFLPPQIRIWGIQRTNNGFNSHTHCDSRVYEYILPTHCFLPPKPGSTAAGYVKSVEAQGRELESEDMFWNSIIEPDFFSLLKRHFAHLKGNPAEEIPALSPEELGKLNRMRNGETEAIRSFRLSPQRLARIISAIQVYQGTHNFHNFTVGVPYHTTHAQRYMISIDVAEPTLIGSTEWLRIKIHGQSFMLHQIRKMIGAMLIAIRLGVGEDLIRTALTTPKTMHIPKAPAQGLLLERPVFSGMSQKLQKFGNEAIDWTQYEEKIDKFKDEFIYRSIFQETTAENVFHEFINFMDSFKYEEGKGLSMFLQDQQTDEPIESFENDDENDVKGDNENVEG